MIKMVNKSALMLAGVILLAPVAVEAKKLKPKYYKDCYAQYDEMRELVPKPPVDIAGTAKTVGQVASIAGRFGGFGGGFGQAASTASTVAAYSDTIADVAEFTKNMAESFPDASDRFRAYGDRMGTEAGEMQTVADFAMDSQSCYASAYTALKQASENGEIKSREVKKRQKEIQTGVDNVSTLLEHAATYMNTNIDAYNKALNQETTGAGFDLGKMVSLASQAYNIKTQVDGVTSGYGDGLAGWTSMEVRVESHRQAMAAHYAAAGIPNPYPEPAIQSGSLLDGFDSLTSIATIGSIDAGLGAHMALEQAIGRAHLANAGYSDGGSVAGPTPVESAPMTEADPRIEALIDAGAEVQPYLEAYNRITALSGMQQGVAAFVDNKL